jgi:uncharacterized protein YjiS (DUF1127 family)
MTCNAKSIGFDHQETTYVKSIALHRLLRIVDFWIERARSRRALGELDERLLQDVGLTADEARDESSMPFWRPVFNRSRP